MLKITDIIKYERVTCETVLIVVGAKIGLVAIVISLLMKG